MLADDKPKGVAEPVGPHGRTLQLALAVLRDQADRAEAIGAIGIAANLREAHDDIEATAGVAATSPAPKTKPPSWFDQLCLAKKRHNPKGTP